MAPADLLFKYSLKRKPSKKLINSLFSALSRYSSALREEALYYLSQQFDTNWDILSNEAKQYFNESEIMTAAEQLQNQARKQYGEEIALRLLDKGMADEDIKEVTGLPTNKLKALKKNLTAKKD